MTRNPWVEVTKGNRRARALADRHYSRGTIGAIGFAPPGQTIILLTPDEKALWGSHRPAPWAVDDEGEKITRIDGFEGHSCFIFRNEGAGLSSELIQEAVGITCHKWGAAPFLTYVAVEKVASVNPGYCYLKAGFKGVGYTKSGKHGVLRKLVMDEATVTSLGETVSALGGLL